jgi:myo-inositol-1-phosphate synthase
MSHAPKIGVWFIGAWGGVATTTALGLAALQQELTSNHGLVTTLPMFKDVPLCSWDQILIGGHEIRETNFVTEAKVLWEKSRVFNPQLINQVRDRLATFDANVRPGTMINVGARIQSFSTHNAQKFIAEKPIVAIERISADLNGFRDANNLEHVIVVNLASTEPPLAQNGNVDVRTLNWSDLWNLIEHSEVSPVPASSIYAISAMFAGCSYINFTPSVGSDIPAIDELAQERNVLHMGRDGKTGETMLKSVLAPMFAARNLFVNSWVGHNIFGNMDGKVLDDPANKATKVRSKDHLLTEILGYKPQSLVSIEYIESLGDWKTAWDHIHFEGFLETKMTMQFTWQGCDSILAAPLVLDLIRIIELERRSGRSGVMHEVSSFFKSPMGGTSPEFAKQYAELVEWVETKKPSK